ncbi:MAG TPA: VOC family protein [Tepidisphaeraceae bacterium]|nr:VOC family protein [Tepidisphaeraceae bacterium]
MLRRIDRILLRVPGLESAVRYYRDVLKLELVRQEPRLASFRLADGTTELVLHADPDLPAEAVYYFVDDVRDLYKRRADLKLTFISAPTPVARGYRATAKDPFGNVMLLLDRTGESAGGRPAAVVEDGKAPDGLFAGVESRVAPKKDVLAKAYEEIGRTADDLPYTAHFEKLYSTYTAAHGDPKPTRAETWRHLLNLRKAGKLPKVGDARSVPPDVAPEAVAKLKELLGTDIGKRDRLPYTDRFEQLVAAFNKVLPRPMSPHHVWRVIAKLAK